MTGNALAHPEEQALRACTVSRNVQLFDLLIDDMENMLGDCWGDLGFAEADAFLNQPEAAMLDFIAVAVDERDCGDLTAIGLIIRAAKDRGIKVLLIAADISPATLHALMRFGADEFVPYPLPENALDQAVQRLARPEPAVQVATDKRPAVKPTVDRDGAVFAVHGLAGGTGATTLAVNLACELAAIDAPDPPRVCLIDLDLQFGSVSTYLDLPRREAVFELLSDPAAMDSDSFMQALLTYDDRLHVLTAPADMLPLDLVGAGDVGCIVEMARSSFDYVVIDMPSTFVAWTETVLNAASIYFVPIELEMRSAQNIQRVKRLLQAEELPIERLRFVLNRAPRFTDLTGRGRIKRLADSLRISLDLQLPDGGPSIRQAGDHGTPLAKAAARSPLRKEIARLARSLHDLNRSKTAKT